MAKKKQSDEEKEDKVNEEFTDDTFEDISDADDSFGLPDVEMEALEESEGEPASQEESDPEPSESSPEKPDKEVMEKQQDKEEYSSGYGKDPGEDKPYNEPSTYEPPKRESIMPKLMIFGAILIIAGGAIWYFLFYKPEQNRIAAEKARQEQIAKEQEEQRQREAEEERKRQEEAQKQAALEAEKEKAEAEVGGITEISERTGRYYIIIGSFIDDDLAKDWGNRLAKEGISTTLISPLGSAKFYKLAVTSHESFSEAQGKIDELKATYGNGLWVLKF